MDRKTFIGGSDANTLMSGDDAAILRLWEEKTGAREPDDLSRVLPVQMGIATEDLNRRWYELTHGYPVTDNQDELHHPKYAFMACHLDGRTVAPSGVEAIFEAKHVNAFSKIEDVVQRYMAQLHHNGACAGLSHAVLSIFKGTLEYEVYEVELDGMYTMELIEREAVFWDAVRNNEPPVHMPAVEPPKPPEQWRTVSMDGNNEWASCAADWIECQEPHKRFQKAEKGLKALMEADVGKAYGHGIEINRAKNGSLRIKEMANAE